MIMSVVFVRKVKVVVKVLLVVQRSPRANVLIVERSEATVECETELYGKEKLWFCTLVVSG